MNSCPACGSKLHQVKELTEISVGRGAATVELVFDRCGTCGEEYVDPEVYATAQATAAAMVRDQLGLLRPEAIRAIRERAGLTQEELEELLGTGPKAVGRWERGTVLQSGMADKLLRVFQQCPGVLHEILRDEAGDTIRQRVPAGELAGVARKEPADAEPEVTSTTTYRLRGEPGGQGHLDENMVSYAA